MVTCVNFERGERLPPQAGGDSSHESAGNRAQLLSSSCSSYLPKDQLSVNADWGKCV